jgi:hypothetical protein
VGGRGGAGEEGAARGATAGTPPGSGERGGSALESHARQPMKTDKLDQGSDLRLRPAQQKLPATGAQPAREHRQIDHQRGVGEHQLAQVDHHV